MKICSVVEGHGEVRAVPVLLHRMLAKLGRSDVQIDDNPIRQSQAKLHHAESVKTATRLAMLRPDCAAVLFLFDGEDECPAELGQRVCAWAMEAAAGAVPCAAVIAYREFETWFLASLESLRGKCGIRDDAAAPVNPEGRRDAKKALKEFMLPRNRGYSETFDQPLISKIFDLELAYERSRSFRKLDKALRDLLSNMRNCR